MSTIERNWLIRTSQNQILGPVAKEKLIEFIQKGALGLTDEVCSGNGYWFHLREKDLVDKYLYGDLPQSYNPISEAKSTLKLKLNPELTSSINVSPANHSHEKVSGKTEEIKTPSADDLEFPDMTLVSNNLVKNLNSDQTKLPSSDDLEFPDITVVKKNLSSQTEDTSISRPERPKPEIQKEQVKKATEVKAIAPSSEEEEICLPNSDDLEYPDLNFISEVQKKVDDEVEMKFEVPELTLEVKKEEIKKEEPKKIETLAKVAARPKEPVKMLHERKVAPKVATTPASAPNNSPLKPRELSPELKNRNDSYLFIVLIVLVLFILGVVFYYYRFILNKPLPV